MYPVMKEMVDEMCTETREAMKKKKPEELGSWERAVTVADGAWMTRGHHSKNFTFSIRNYFTGELLFRKHLCQKGRDYIIKDELYKGTSKGAEGFAARLLFKDAKDLGMNVAINWQDDDSSTAKAIKEIFPEPEIILYRGHEGRSHLKQLRKLQTMKKFSSKVLKKHQEYLGDIKDEKCWCEKRHVKGCGCFTDTFITNSRNLLSHIISTSDSEEEFARRVRTLYHHAIDEHEWKDDDGEDCSCDFHQLTVCSCGKCPDKSKHDCEGKKYKTRVKLECPFHKMAYRTEIEHRARKASSLIHSQLGTQTGWNHPTTSLFASGPSISPWKGFTTSSPQI